MGSISFSRGTMPSPFRYGVWCDAMEMSSPMPSWNALLAPARRIGGTSGPIWGTAMLRAGVQLKEHPQIEGTDVVRALRASIEGIKARGQAPGSAVDATGTMNLMPGDDPDTTVMVWAADVVISGMIASVGARLIEGTANKLIGQTFDCVKSRLEG